MADLALVLSADHYAIPDQGTGEIQNLFQIWYCNDYREDSAKEIGFKPIKMLASVELFETLKKHPLPALYELDLRSRPGKGNAAALTVVGVKFVSTPSIFGAPAGAPADLGKKA